MCLRVAHGMACVLGELPPKEVRWTIPLAAIPLSIRPKAKANATQIGGQHYKQMGIQTWDVVDTWPLEQQIGYYRGSALKYLMRMGSKDERAQEIRKAEHYCQKLAEVLEKAQEPA